SDGPAGPEGDSFVVSFAGRPNEASRTNSGVPTQFTANQGLWTELVDVARPLTGGPGFVLKTASALPVVQVGDTVGGAAVNSITVYDPLAGATRDPSGLARTPRRGDAYVAFVAG